LQREKEKEEYRVADESPQRLLAAQQQRNRGRVVQGGNGEGAVGFFLL